MHHVVTLYETNSDIVYLQLDDGPAWCLGPVTPDMDGGFAEDAAAWAAGDWEPGPHNGQSESIPAAEVDDDAGLVPAAAWAGGTVTLARDEDSLGFAARAYLAVAQPAGA